MVSSIDKSNSSVFSFDQTLFSTAVFFSKKGGLPQEKRVISIKQYPILLTCFWFK